jgi:hypothetical protein
LYPDYFDYDFSDWIGNKENVILKKGMNLAFGERKGEGLYFVHFCFHEARGREAIKLTERMFQEFCRLAPVKTAIGLIHVDNKKARWLIRHVSFTSLGLIETENGTCEMFYRKGI